MKETETVTDIKEKIEKMGFSDLNDNRFYEYFKAHPGTLITFTSAMIAVIGFFNRMIQYANFTNYLKYWGWNSIKIQMSPGNISYTLIFSILNLTIIVLTGALFLKYINPHFRQFLLGKEYQKMQPVPEQTETQLSDANRLLKKELRSIVLTIPCVLILDWILYLLDVSLLYHDSVQSRTVPIALVFSSAVVGICTILNYSYTKEEIKKELHQIISRKNELKERLWTDFFSLKAFFSRKNIVFILFTVAVILLLSVVSSGFIIPNTSEKRDFSIVTVEDQQYMLVYNSGTTYYLNRIDIKEGTLTVYTNEHHVLSNNSGSILIRDMHFEKVNRVTHH